MKWEQAVLGGRKIILMRKKTIFGNSTPWRVIIDDMYVGDICGGDMRIFHVDENEHDLFVDSGDTSVQGQSGAVIPSGTEEYFCYASSREITFRFPLFVLCDNVDLICEV